jgi:hypothetical protein
MSDKEIVLEENESPRGEVKRYIARPGFRFCGLPDFPFETDDIELQNKIEGTTAFTRAGRVWLDTKSDDERSAEEKALAGVDFNKLRKMARALGLRDYSGLSKAELIEVISKEM